MTAASYANVASAILSRWSKARCMSRAAALSFYAVFSLGPILVIVVTAGSFLAGSSAFTASLLYEIGHLMGDDGRALAVSMLESASSSKGGWFALGASVLLLFSATTAFAELKDGLDDIFGAPRVTEQAALWKLLRTRLLSFGLVLALALVLIALLISNAILTAGAGVVASYVGADVEQLLRLAGEAATIAGTFVLFAATYKLLPAERLSWKKSLIAAAITTALFHAGRYAVAVYMGHVDVGRGFGAAGSLAIVLLWVNYTALAFLAGAVLASEWATLLELSQAGKTTQKGARLSPRPS